MIENENRRLHERFSILAQFQGLLFTALSLGWDKNLHLIILIAIVGILSAVTIGGALQFAIIAMIKLTDEYDLIPKGERDLEGPVIGLFPAKFRHNLFARFISYPFAIPLLVLPAWICIIYIKLQGLK